MAAKWWLRVFGAACIAIGIVHLVFGPPSIIAGGLVNATIDSELRFYATLFVGFGGGFIWAAADLVRRSALVHVLSGLFPAGGLARLLAIWQSGVPHAFYVLLIVIEIAVPIINWILLARIR